MTHQKHPSRAAPKIIFNVMTTMMHWGVFRASLLSPCSDSKRFFDEIQSHSRCISRYKHLLTSAESSVLRFNVIVSTLCACTKVTLSLLFVYSRARMKLLRTSLYFSGIKSSPVGWIFHVCSFTRNESSFADWLVRCSATKRPVFVFPQPARNDFRLQESLVATRNFFIPRFRVGGRNCITALSIWVFLVVALPFPCNTQNSFAVRIPDKSALEQSETELARRGKTATKPGAKGMCVQ